MHNERSAQPAQPSAAAQTSRIRDSYIPRACPITGSEELSAYSDGMLEGDALRRIDAHAAGCPECAAWLRDLQYMRSLAADVRDLPRQPGEEYWSRLFRAARQRDRQQAPVSLRPGFWLQRSIGRRWTVAAVSAAVCFAAGIIALIAPQGAYAPRSSASGAAASVTAVDHPSSPSSRSNPISSGDLGLSALVESHARMVSDQPLEDHTRAASVVSDLGACATGEAAVSPTVEIAGLQPFPETECRSAAAVD